MQNATDDCKALYGEFDVLTKDVNIYNIFGICYGTSINPALYSSEKKGMTAADYTPWLYPKSRRDAGAAADPLGDDTLPPCTFGTPLMTYFDRTDVRTALHIDADIGPWLMCTNGIDYTRQEIAS